MNIRADDAQFETSSAPAPDGLARRTGMTPGRFDWSLLLGYDIFISYKRSAAASSYSRNLRNALSELGFKCFLDQEQTEGGVELTPALQKALHRSRLMIVLAEPNVVRSEYVPEEIRTFSSKRKGRIVPINIGGFLAVGKQQPAPFDYLQTLTWLNESEQNFEQGSPTEPILAGIRTSFGRLRVAAISRAITWAAIFILATTAVVALLQRQAAVREAEMSLAHAYASDLNLAELAHDRRDTPAVLELLARYAARLGEGRFPEFAWLRLWGLYNRDRYRLAQDPEESSLAISPDGRTIVTTIRFSSDTKGGVVRVWDMSSGRLRLRTDLSKGTNAGAVAFAPDGRLFATLVQDYGRDQQQIVVWDTSTGQSLKTVVAKSIVGALAFTRDSRWIVAPCASGFNAPFQMWDLETGVARYTNDVSDGNERITAWAYAPDGRTVALGYDEAQVNGVIRPRHIAVWDTEKRTVLADFVQGDDTLGMLQVVGGLAYSPDSRVLAASLGTSMSVNGYSTSPEGRVRLWDLESRRPLGVLEGHKAGAHSVAFTHDGTLLVSASGEPDASRPGKDSQVIVWDLHSRKPLVTLDQPRTGFVRQIVSSPTSSLLALVSEDAIVTLLDAAKAQVITQLRGHSKAITALSFAPDGRMLATVSSDGSARIWDTAVQPDAQLFGEPAEELTSTAFSRDGVTVALGLSTGSVVLKNATGLHLLGRVLPTPAPVKDLAFSGDGRRLAAYTRGAILVWDLDTGRLRPPLSATEGIIHALRLDQSGRYVTAAIGDVSKSNTVLERWDTEASQRLTLRQLGAFTQLLAMSEDGESVALRRFDQDPTIEIHDMSSGRQRPGGVPAASGAQMTAAAFSPEGARLAIAESGRYMRQRGIRVLDARTLKPVLELPVRGENVHALAFDAAGGKLVSAGYGDGMVTISPRMSFYQVMCRVRIWDVGDGAERLSFSVESANINELTRIHQSRLHVLGSGHSVAVKERNALLLVDAQTGRVIVASRPAAATVHSAGGTPDNRTLVVTVRPGIAGATEVVKVWDAQTHMVSATLPELPAAEAWSMAFSRDGRTLAVGSEAASVRLYDTITAAVTNLLEGHQGAVLSLAFSTDGRTLTTAAADATVKTWNIATGHATQVAGLGSAIAVGIAPGADALASTARDGTLTAQALPGGANRITASADATSDVPPAFSPDGKVIAVASRAPAGTISIRDRLSGKEIARLQGEQDVQALALSSEGLVAVGSVSGGVTIWQISGSRAIATLPPSRNVVPKPSVLSLAFDPVAARLAAGHGDGTIAVWQKDKEWRPTTTLSGHNREIRAISFSPDSATLASADTQGRVVLWDVTPSRQPKMRAVLRHDRSLAIARLAPDGKTIATGGNDKAVVLWDLASGARQAVLLGHTAPVTSLAFAAAGQLLASGSSAEVIMWDVEAQRRLSRIEGSAPMHLAANGERVATTIDASTVGIWRARSGSLQTQIRGLAERPSVLAFSANAETLGIIAGNRATLWDADSGTALPALSGYQGGQFAALAIAPDGNTLATAGQGRIDLWHVLTGRRLITLRDIDEAAVDLSFSANATSLIAATKNGIRFWTAPRAWTRP